MTITKNRLLTSFYEEFEGDNEVRRMFLTDKFNSKIFQRQFDLLNIKPGMQIMDFGCGPGFSTRDLARRSDPGLVLGIDLKESAINTAKKLSELEGIENTRFLKMNAAKVISPNNKFHLTFARNLFMHVPRPKNILKEMIRVTKPGGIIAVVSTDGFMSNIHPVKGEMKDLLGILKGIKFADITIGRELYSHFIKLGLEDIKVHIDSWVSCGVASSEEKEYWALMFQQLEPLAEQVFGGVEKLKKYRVVWFDFLNRKDRFDYFQYFLVTGHKPQ
ncbi:MAG: class I SAM-dependent methyltransferase [Candidatus Helarchaeota archaeon]